MEWLLPPRRTRPAEIDTARPFSWPIRRETTLHALPELALRSPRRGFCALILALGRREHDRLWPRRHLTQGTDLDHRGRLRATRGTSAYFVPCPELVEVSLITRGHVKTVGVKVRSPTLLPSRWVRINKAGASRWYATSRPSLSSSSRSSTPHHPGICRRTLWMLSRKTSGFTETLRSEQLRFP